MSRRTRRTVATSESSARPDAQPLPAALAALPGSAVTRLIIDDSLTLVLQAPGNELVLRIDGSGRWQWHGETASFSADADPASLAPLLGLLQARVVGVALADDGRLELRFDQGALLSALPDDHQIAWTVRSAGASATCLAEGKVVWQ